MASWLIQSIAICAVCVFLAGLLIPQILLIAYRKKLFDEPDERKIHQLPIPRLGGIAFTPVICFSLSLWLGLSILDVFPNTLSEYVPVREFSFGFCALLMLYIVGMADDLVGVRYRAKFVIQLLCALLLICGGLCCVDFNGVFGLYAVSPWIGGPATLLMVVFVINSINLIDGIDGLASGLSMVCCLIYGVTFGLIGEVYYALVAFATIGVLLPFFYYNVFGSSKVHNKIFMGDTGALTTGLIICFMGLALLKESSGLEGCIFDTNAMIIVLSPLMIPGMDVVRVFMYRIINHGNPFLPDRTHIHHLLLNLGMKPRAAMVSIICASVVLCLFNIFISRYININLVLLTDFVLFIIGYACIQKFKASHKNGGG